MARCRRWIGCPSHWSPERYWASPESGCGKSTLLRLISGLEPPDTGKLLLRGQALSARRSRDQLRAVQLIVHAAGSFLPAAG